MAINILIPYNFTVNDEKAIEFVGQRYRGETQIDITLYHAFTPIPEIDTKNNPIMDKMNRNIIYLHQRKEELKEALEEAGKKMMEFGFDQGQIHCLFRPLRNDIAEDIIKLWQDKKFDVIVLNRNPGNIINYFTKSTSKRITSYKDGVIGVHIIN